MAGTPGSSSPSPFVFCESSSYSYASGCSACTSQAVVPGHLWRRTQHCPRGEAAQQEPGSGNLLPWYLAETQQSCSGRKSAKTLQLLPFLHMGATGFVSCFTPGSNPSSLGLLTRYVSAPEGRLQSVPFPTSPCVLTKLHASTDEVQPHRTCDTRVQSCWRGTRFGKLQRPSLEPCHAPVPPTAPREFPHLLLLALLLLLELIQHSLETGLQRQTCQTSHQCVLN